MDDLVNMAVVSEDVKNDRRITILSGQGFFLVSLEIKLAKNFILLNLGMGLINALEAPTDAPGAVLRFVPVALLQRLAEKERTPTP